MKLDLFEQSFVRRIKETPSTFTRTGGCLAGLLEVEFFELTNITVSETLMRFDLSAERWK